MYFRMMLRFVALLGMAQASLRGKTVSNSSSLSVDVVKATVLEEVMAALGSGHRVTSDRLKAIEDVLKPTFEAMPKNAHGNLEDAAARYVLHRLFVSRHAMHIKGLEAGGWNGTSTKEVLREHIPSLVLSLFEDRLEGQGLGLHELVVLAATLEHLIHDEAVQRLSGVYEAQGRELDAVHPVELQDLIDGYMTIYLMGEGTTTKEDREKVAEAYPGWHSTRKFTMAVSSELLAQVEDNVSFQLAMRIVEEIGERYGRWQDSECQDLRRLMSKYEHGSTGRVLLKDFYGAALDGNWQFSESVEYLRELGALDESDAEHLAVVIPNYINSQSNCVASSSIYAVCCINECEALLGHLERHVAAPEADAEQLLELVAQLPSASQPARRPSKELAERLQEVARVNGGTVPLHGRLFSQWLHHAYPRECPYPHVTSGNPMTADEWMQAKGKHVAASKEDMRRYASATKTPATTSMPWNTEEKLVAKHRSPPGAMRKVLWLFSACAICWQMLRIALQSFRHSQEMLLPVKHHAC